MRFFNLLSVYGRVFQVKAWSIWEGHRRLQCSPWCPAESLEISSQTGALILQGFCWTTLLLHSSRVCFPIKLSYVTKSLETAFSVHSSHLIFLNCIAVGEVERRAERLWETEVRVAWWRWGCKVSIWYSSRHEETLRGEIHSEVVRWWNWGGNQQWSIERSTLTSRYSL